jgi:aldehyde dehydrogenase (NAD+)
MYGDDIKKSRFYPRIINEKSVHRLGGLLKEGKIYRW